ncbi:MAG: hypothetical protein HXY25_06770 [Alphaproteobacteria bacterium]|nr:hypothetical protein [Alphaproteobacteria bacterium]
MQSVMLLLGAGAGVALLGLASAALGGWRRVRLDAEAEARARLAHAEPDFPQGPCLLDALGRAALFEAAEGTDLALVLAVGDHVAVRRFPPQAVRGARLCERAGVAELDLRLADWTLPPVRLGADRAVLEGWARRLGAGATVSTKGQGR